MKGKAAYQVIKYRRVSEKARMLESLSTLESNPSIKKCKKQKYVFVVDKNANKAEIAEAVLEIYAEKNVKVLSVNTILMKPKPRRVRGRLGKTDYYKKAIVTLEAGDIIDEQV